MIVAKIFRQLIAVIAISSLTVFTAPTLAIPLVFEFTGTISNTVLIFNTEQTLYTSHPQWNGQKVTGTFTIDLSKVEKKPNLGPGYTDYSSEKDTYPYTDWIWFNITNPDGSIIDISASIPISPAPEAEGDDANTQLFHHPFVGAESSFYVLRTYSSLDPFPRNHASLSLKGIGSDGSWLTSSADYNDVIIKPEFANVENYGSVQQFNDQGVGHEYYFRVESIKRKSAHVPESSLMLMFVSSLLLIYWKRRKIFF